MEPSETRYVERQVGEMLRFAGLAPGQRVLEVGCGMGRYTFALAARGLRVEGLDLSPVLLERLRDHDNGRFNIPLHCADILHPPESLHGQFDAVLGFFTLHHLHDVESCYQSMARLVRPGGLVAFLEPNPYCALYYFQILLTPGMTWRGDRGLVHMTKRVLGSAMRKAGLPNQRRTRFGFFPPFLANRPWAARFEARLERLLPLRPFLPFQIFVGS
jgi:SAM-dependent methyltransferase